jgi:hypothetical protein
MVIYELRMAIQEVAMFGYWLRVENGLLYVVRSLDIWLAISKILLAVRCKELRNI